MFNVKHYRSCNVSVKVQDAKFVTNGLIINHGMFLKSLCRYWIGRSNYFDSKYDTNLNAQSNITK